MKDFFGLRGKVALVLGGSIGIGEATALTLADAGADVAVLDIDPERAGQVAEAARQRGVRAIALQCDALDEARAEAVIDEVVTRLGAIDVMATIVGQAAWAPFLEVSPEMWSLDHSRNLRYFFVYAQAAARAMVKAGNGGAIVAISSISGIQSAPNHSAYGAAKAGLINLAKSMAVELAQYDIRVNTVAPGATWTPRIAESGDPEQKRARLAGSLVPYKRYGNVQGIADAVLFLASRMAGFVTGQTIAVDGGLTAAFGLGLLPIPSSQGPAASPTAS